MKTKMIVVFVAAIMALTVATMAVQSDDANAAEMTTSNDNGVYKLTYYAEIEGNTISEKQVAVTGGTSITMYAIPAIDGYTFVGWEYNGVVYKVGEKFAMPESDATLTAEWEAAALADKVLVTEDATMIFLIISALFAISAIIGVVVIMKMRASAIRCI